MFKKLVPAVCFISFLFLSTGSILAEAVVVKGDKIFVADYGLRVLNIADGLPADCSEGLGLDTITDATDVVITNDGTAVVTVNTGGTIDVEIVDVSSCLSVEVGVRECVATADLDEGVMEVPCVYIDGVVYDVHMEQHGNSMNWEVTFAETNDDMSEYEHGDDDGNDDNGDDDGDDDNSNDDDSSDDGTTLPPDSGGL